MNAPAAAVRCREGTPGEDHRRRNGPPQRSSGELEEALVDDDAVADRGREHGLTVTGLPRPHRERLARQDRRGEASLDVVEAGRIRAAQRVQQCRAR